MTNRRSLSLSAALVVVFAVAVGLAVQRIPVARAQAPTVLKIQASWPASLTIYDHLKLVAERVDKLSNGTLKIEPLPAGTIVPAFEVLDATNRKVIDGAHTVASPRYRAAVARADNAGATSPSGARGAPAGL
jgi:TRAP-type mannitol/chloroaromatic compound transport system substrate-binding protein